MLIVPQESLIVKVDSVWPSPILDGPGQLLRGSGGVAQLTHHQASRVVGQARRREEVEASGQSQGGHGDDGVPRASDVEHLADVGGRDGGIGLTQAQKGLPSAPRVMRIAWTPSSASSCP